MKLVALPFFFHLTRNLCSNAGSQRHCGVVGSLGLQRKPDIKSSKIGQDWGQLLHAPAARLRALVDNNSRAAGAAVLVAPAPGAPANHLHEDEQKWCLSFRS